MSILNGLLAKAQQRHDERLTLAVLSNLAFGHCSYGDAEKAFEYIIAAQRLAERLKVPSLSAKIELRYVWILYKLGSLRETVRRVNIYLANPVYVLENFNFVLLLQTLGLSYLSLQQWEFARQTFLHAIAGAVTEDAGKIVPYLRIGVVRALIGPAMHDCILKRHLPKSQPSLFTKQDFGEIQEQLAEAERAMRGNEIGMAHASFERARFGLLCGDLPAAEEGIKQHITWSASVGDQYQLVLGNLALAEFLLLRGKGKPALPILARKVVTLPGDLYALVEIHRAWLTSWAHETLREWEQALRSFQAYAGLRDQRASQDLTAVSPPYFLLSIGRTAAGGENEKSAYGDFSKAVEYIKTNLFQAITPANVAVHVGLSVRRLQTLFQEELGTSPRDYIAELRLAEARARLEAGSRKATSVSEVAKICGFTRIATFARLYKARYGELPSATLK